MSQINCRSGWPYMREAMHMLFLSYPDVIGAWQSCDAAEIAEKYVPGPVEVGPEIWVGTIAACVPFVIGSWEFGKRIVSAHQISPNCCYAQQKHEAHA